MPVIAMNPRRCMQKGYICPPGGEIIVSDETMSNKKTQFQRNLLVFSLPAIQSIDHLAGLFLPERQPPGGQVGGGSMQVPLKIEAAIRPQPATLLQLVTAGREQTVGKRRVKKYDIKRLSRLIQPGDRIDLDDRQPIHPQEGTVGLQLTNRLGVPLDEGYRGRTA